MQDKQQIIQELFDGFHSNLKLSQDILKVLEAENEALKRMDTVSLLRLSKEKSTLLAKTHYLDDALKKSVCDLVKKTAMKTAPPPHTAAALAAGKINALTSILPADKAEVVTRYKAKLNALRLKIQERNFINKRFIEDTMGYLGDAISLLTGPTHTPNKTYGYKGLPPVRGRSVPSVISREV